MTRRQFGVGLAVVSTKFNFASGDPASMTFGKTNGRSWQTMDQASRSSYLFGFIEGASLDASVATATLRALKADSKTLHVFESSSGDLVPAGMTINETIAAIDRIYEEPENLFLPISVIVALVSAKVKGASPSNIQNRLAKERAWYSDPANDPSVPR